MYQRPHTNRRKARVPNLDESVCEKSRLHSLRKRRPEWPARLYSYLVAFSKAAPSRHPSCRFVLGESSWSHRLDEFEDYDFRVRSEAEWGAPGAGSA